MTRTDSWATFTAAAATLLCLSLNSANAVLYVYEPFNYTVGENLGGSGESSGTPIGQMGTYAAGGGSGAYNWYARGTASNYQSAFDVLVNSGSLSYNGLATSTGNSVSYGSVDNSAAAAATNPVLYANSIPLPVSVTSGDLYASFIVRIKSRIYDGTTSSAYRHAVASFVTDTSTSENAGTGLAGSVGSSVPMPASFWMRRDPVAGQIDTTNFSPGKSNSDGIGPGAPGPSSGWQHSAGGANIEANQFGDTDGQSAVTNQSSVEISPPQTYFVVLKYSFDVMPPDGTNNNQADTVSMWMNPGSATLGTEGGETLASQAASGNVGSYYAAIGAFGTATVDAASINSFALIAHRQGTPQTIGVDFDEPRIGTTWEDVTPAAAGPPGVQGDYNGNGVVDSADYVLWRNGGPLQNEVDVPGTVNAADYNAWRSRYGNTSGSGTAVPEPALVAMLIASLGGSLIVRLRS